MQPFIRHHMPKIHLTALQTTSWTTTRKRSNEKDMVTVSDLPIARILVIRWTGFDHFLCFICVPDTDTDLSESEALSSLQISGHAKNDESGELIRSLIVVCRCFHSTDFWNEMYVTRLSTIVGTQVHRIETKTAPKPSQPEVVLSDGKYLCYLLHNRFTDGQQVWYSERRRDFKGTEYGIVNNCVNCIFG